jgi:hypothetical protein
MRAFGDPPILIAVAVAVAVKEGCQAWRGEGWCVVPHPGLDAAQTPVATTAGPDRRSRRRRLPQPAPAREASVRRARCTGLRRRRADRVEHAAVGAAPSCRVRRGDHARESRERLPVGHQQLRPLPTGRELPRHWGRGAAIPPPAVGSHRRPLVRRARSRRRARVDPLLGPGSPGGGIRRWACTSAQSSCAPAMRRTFPSAVGGSTLTLGPGNVACVFTRAGKNKRGPNANLFYSPTGARPCGTTRETSPTCATRMARSLTP